MQRNSEILSKSTCPAGHSGVYVVGAVLGVLAGCASGAPHAYADGPMLAPPRAPAFDPTFDAPNPFERPQAPRIQPQPVPTRTLPETPETRKGPGIWASSNPRNAQPLVLGIRLPYIDGASLDDMSFTLSCAEMMGASIQLVDKASVLASQAESMRRCLAASLYHACATEVLEGNKRAKAEGEFDATYFERFVKTQKRAKQFVDEACSGQRPPRDVVDMLNVVTGAYLEKLALLTNYRGIK